MARGRSRPSLPGMRCLLCCTCVLALTAGAASGEAVQDPSQAVVAESPGIYRQRDLEAPLITKADEGRARRVLIQARIAREPFADAPQPISQLETGLADAPAER
jgi:hypothetical protein